MTSKAQKIKCLFGHHNYTIPDKTYSFILICQHCKRLGHYRGVDGFEEWYGYDEKGNRAYYTNSTGYEVWYEYNERGNIIHRKDSNECETWFEYDKQGNVIIKRSCK